VNNRKKILVVDDEAINLSLIERMLQQDGYQVSFTLSGQDALRHILQTEKPDLILLDIQLPDINGLDLCRTLKARPATADIPVIFITASDDRNDEVAGFEVGGVDYIQKPISQQTLRARVKTHLSLVRTEQLERLSRSSIFMLGEASHYNDDDTGAHVWRIADYAAALARADGRPKDEGNLIKLAAPLHDTGKIGIPDSILQKPGKLTNIEWDIMKKHVSIGYDILDKNDLPVFRTAALVAKYHHERWDGTGYPEGLSALDIPYCARVVAVADVFDALTSNRPYKEAWSVEESFDQIANCAGTHFDPCLAERFLKQENMIRRIKRKWENTERTSKELNLFS